MPPPKAQIEKQRSFSPLGDGLSSQKVSVHLANVPFADALKEVFDQISAGYAFDLGRYERQSVTLSLDNVPVGKCVTSILEEAHAIPELAFETFYGIAIIGYKFPKNSSGTEPMRYPMADTVHLKFTKENAYCAAYAVAHSASEYFTLSEDFKSREVTLKLSDVPITKAFQSIGIACKTPLITLYDKPVLLIAPVHPKNNGYTNCPPGAPPIKRSPKP